ncbi:YdcF family protein [Jeotgalibacillus proteolyticus]|uniref:DUF218 domain-containing protein n=1 Tax=Jeotgalibacillus proteolyticus TaxID=2082395 RepID=A0A2S5GBV6_9BACL|nr:YdcF family protein [Jeotgalibacillus proteolyticus]PPA70438.1 hypothetical protein C4B60_12760 [Jeotgalibacillus proteolyticus]
MYISELDKASLTLSQMNKLLYEGIEDDQKSGDCIFVAGSSMAATSRLPKAVELYKQGRAGKILVSGGVVWKGTPYSESITLKKEAIKLGVPEKDILTEGLSHNTLENVLASLLVLNRAFYIQHIRRILIVTSPYHIKRLHLTMKTYMPSWIEFTLCPSKDQLTKIDRWHLTEEGRNRVRIEAEKIIDYVKQGALVDEKL